MYVVYKITNKINSKYYIGVHKTDHPNDGYMGSGKAIKKAIEKCGRENFYKEILFITEIEKVAYEKEKELTVDFCNRSNYNMKLGGIGGFTSENAKKGYLAAAFSKELLSKNGKENVKKFTKEQRSENGRKGGLKNKGRKKGPMNEETKEKIRQSLLKNKQARIEQLVSSVCS